MCTWSVCGLGPPYLLRTTPVFLTLYCCLFQIQYCTPIARAIAALLADIRWMKLATCPACAALPALRNQSLARPTPWMLVLDLSAVFGRQLYPWIDAGPKFARIQACRRFAPFVKPLLQFFPPLQLAASS
jgi:hypothetical protein